MTTDADVHYLSATVPRETFVKCQSDLIDLLGQRNHYRDRAHEAEENISHVLRYLDDTPIINRAELFRLLGC